MAQYLVQMSRRPTSLLARDRVVTTFHLDSDADLVLGDGGSAQSLAEDAAELFGTTIGGAATFDGWEARIYRHGGAKGDPPDAFAFYSVAGSAALGPREVACCLSYFAGVNIPRRRGRMYIGPWTITALAERPSQAVREMIAGLAEGLSGLGGPNIQWVQYSPTDGVFTNVTDYFIDDEWDTIRSRGLRATARTVGTVSG